VNTENGAIDDCSEDKEVKDLTTRLPYGGVTIFLLTFFIKAIYLGNLAGLVVATNEGDAIRVSETS
jgi:hypothetical protein